MNSILKRTRIATFNSLDERYGSTYRFRALSALMKPEFEIFHFESSGSPIEKLKVAVSAARTEYDLLFTQKFNPITSVAILIAYFRKKPIFVDWDDLDITLQSNFLKRWIAKFCEAIFPRFATGISTHSSLIESVAKTKCPRTYYIQQGVNLSLFVETEESRSNIRSELCIHPNDFLVGHLCTFTSGGAKNLPFILDAWGKLQDPRFKFLLIGGGPLERKIKELIATLGLTHRVYLTGLIPQSKVPHYLSALDCGVVWMDETESDRARVSFKVLEYLTMNLPVVGRVTGETERLFGRLITACDEKSFLDRLMDQEKIRSRPNTRKDVETYSWDNEKSNLLRAVQSTLSQK